VNQLVWCNWMEPLKVAEDRRKESWKVISYTTPIGLLLASHLVLAIHISWKIFHAWLTLLS
jgi:hypothetical protein